MLTVPGPASATSGQVVGAVTELVRITHPGLPVHVTHIDGLAGTLASVKDAPQPDMPGAVIVPLIAGPLPAIAGALREAADNAHAAGRPVVVTQPLGPHPLIAQALHVRLAEAGLARADRIRMLTMVTAADGIVVATTGGEAGVRAAEVTGVLLAARLAVPVIAGGLDIPSGVSGAARRLREAGATRLALSACVIGPEADNRQIAAAAAEIGAEFAGPLGAEPSIGQLITLRYVEALEEFLASTAGG